MSREQHYRAIWREGGIVDGVQHVATLIHTAIGETFADACNAYSAENPRWARAFCPKTLTHMGLRLFPSYEQARTRTP